MDKDDNEFDNDTGEAVGSRNDERLALMSQISDSSEEFRQSEFGDTPEGEEQELEEASGREEDYQEEQEHPQESQPTYKLVVNGKEKQVDLDYLIRTASKVEAADEYLAQAKRQIQEQPSPDVARHQAEEDDLALARALQMGTEEEAANVIRRLRGDLSSPDDIASKAIDRLRFEQDVNWFKDEYKDVYQDPFLRRLAIDLDEEAVKNGDNRSYRERFTAIGEDLRKWKGTTSLQQKQERKSSIDNLPSASAKVPQPKDDEPDDSPRSVIAEMARSRGQMI